MCDRKVYLTIDDIGIVYADPRILIVGVGCISFSAALVSACAPYDVAQ